MGLLKSGIVVATLSSLLGAAVAVGCTADGTSSVAAEEPATEPVPPATLPPSSGATPATKKDGGKPKPDPVDPPDAEPVDAGPPPPNPGDPCTDSATLFDKPCGACGTQQARCVVPDDASAGTVSIYGACTGEVVGGCIAGSTTKEACGNCGTRTNTCDDFCSPTLGACVDEPPMACPAGMVEYTAAGCVAGSGTFAKRTCSTTCQWGGYSATCAAPINDIVLEISPTIGQTASVDITFSSAKMGDRLYAHDTCPIPAGNSLTKGDYPYQYVEIKNATATAATVTLFASAAAGAPAMDTVMAAYGTPLQPMDDTARRACAWGVDDDSESSDPTGSTGFSILKAVPIAAHSSILVYVASYYDLTNTGTVQTGPLKVNVKTDAL